jgi:hypothetical protein
MNEQDQLLREILAGDELARFRRASLEKGLIQMRQLRSRRRAVRACAFATLPLLLALALFVVRTPGSRQWPRLASIIPVANSASTQDEPAKTKFITDEELFALFPDRPAVLIGKPGQQELVFLDNNQGSVARNP